MSPLTNNSITMFTTLSLLAGALPTASFAAIATAGPMPENPSSIEAQLKRYRGQTQFLNPAPFASVPKSAPAKGGQNRSPEGAGAQRAQQESDVFKIGKPGSKLLYLLNNYRGLQVVSYADGANRPKLVGRVAATGNWADDMYHVSERDQLLVLENDYSEHSARVLVYDVKDPSRPKITGELKLSGYIADSRIVGDVMYVATSSYEDRKGHVYSLSLKSAAPSIVQHETLALPSSSRENMNIVEVSENGAYRYYLVAVLSESGWGWWDRKSLVEVIDISDAHGRIEPLMVVSSKGNVRERSQTHIKNGVLIVTSNYTPDDDGSKPARIAVETFKLPSQGSEHISENEAQFRKLRIERELAKAKESDREALQDKLASDAELGLKDRFVKTTDGKLRKVIADSVVTVGDTTGQHASLQDVRYDGDLLHAFWVPRNQIDPLDLFDISQPEKGVKYLKRLQFDGWIERSIPMTHNNRKFVLGLGWVVPAVNNEKNRRYPQAMLFEIVMKNSQPRAVELAQLTLSNGNVWTNFNGADKFVEVRREADGTGTIMFGVDGYENGAFTSGGKIVHFDLNAEAFREGVLLAGQSDWLKRVFTNPEIAKVNTFSDQALGTYDVAGAGPGSKIVNAMHVLELARNIEGYEVLKADGGHRGIQIISDGYYWDARKKVKTILRLVKAEQADAERDATFDEVELEGRFETSNVSEDLSRLYVATRLSREEKDARGNIVFRTKHLVYRINLAGDETNKLSVSQPASWVSKQDEGSWRWGYYGGAGFQLIRLDSGALIAKDGTQLISLSAKSELAATRIELSGCELESDANVELQLVDGRLFLMKRVMQGEDKHTDLRYTRNFASLLKLSGTSASCGKAVNIPGRIIAVVGDNQWITEDERLLDFGAPEKNRQWLLETAIDSLAVSDTTAKLADDYVASQARAGSIFRLAASKLGFLESESRDHGYYPRYEGIMGMPMCKGPGCHYPRPQQQSRLTVLGFDESLRFTKEVFAMGSEALPNASLAALFTESDGSKLGVISNGSKVQAVRFQATTLRPFIQPPVKLSGWSSRYHYSPALKTIEIASGLFGVQQLRVE